MGLGDRIRKLEYDRTLTAQQIAGLPVRRAQGGGGGGTSNSVAKAVVTSAAGASSHSSAGISYGTAGECVLLDDEGTKLTGDEGDPVEFKSLHRVGIPVDAIIEISAPNTITAGSEWSDNPVVGRFADVADELAQRDGFGEKKSLAVGEGGTAADDIEWLGEECEVV